MQYSPVTNPATPRVPLDPASTDAEICEVVEEWLTANVPERWRAAAPHGRAAIRAVRPRAEYDDWYPTFADSGLAVATWPLAYGGLDLSREQAMVAEEILAPLNLGRLNPLGLNNCAPALFAYGTEDQRLRFLPPMVRNEQRWCQMFSEPGAGSDLASLACRAELDGDEWVLTGQKVWSTWAHRSEWAICLARTDPRQPKRRGITYFLVDLRLPGVTVRELRHMGGSVDFNEVFLDEVRVPDSCRVGAPGEGWRVAAATLAGERQMVARDGSGGVDRIGGGSVDGLVGRIRAGDVEAGRVARLDVVKLVAEDRIRSWTNARVRATVEAGGTPGPAASIGKVHQASLNQRTQMSAFNLTPARGMTAQAWPGGRVPDMPFETSGMLRSRANSIEGGTTEINKNVLAELVLGLPREPDPWYDATWQETPRS
jgi:alkylation response protein AidB-like acyl-CoA dehydrogenase